MGKIRPPVVPPPAPNSSFVNDTDERKREMGHWVLNQQSIKGKDIKAIKDFICELVRRFNADEKEILEAAKKIIVPWSKELGANIQHCINAARKQVLSELIPEYYRLKSENDLLRQQLSMKRRPLSGGRLKLPVNGNHRQSSDSIASFLVGYRPSTTTCKILTKFHGEYKAFCAVNGYEAEGRNTFYKRCRDAEFPIKKEHNRLIFIEN